MNRATDEQNAYILQLARRSNMHDNCLPTDQLIIKIESRESVSWETLTDEQAETLMALYKSKRLYRQRAR